MIEPGPGEAKVVINYTPEQQRRAGYYTVIFGAMVIAALALGSEGLDKTHFLPEGNDVWYGIAALVFGTVGLGGFGLNQEIWRKGKREYIADIIPD